jgi:GT2 family glycosyltransferase
MLFFSVIVPTRNRKARLKALLQSLTELDYPRDRYEVIVVDDGGVEEPFDLQEGGPLSRLRILRQKPSGPAAARNRGAEAAVGQALAFLDDDCTPPPDWLQRLEGRFEQTPECAIGGKTVNGLPHNPCSAATDLVTDFFLHHQNRRQLTFLPSSALAVPARLFREVGGFDTSFPTAAGEDREFCRRWVARGYELVYDPAIVIWHRHEMGLTSFLSKHFQYGRAAQQFWSRRPQRPGGSPPAHCSSCCACRLPRRRACGRPG